MNVCKICLVTRFFPNKHLYCIIMKKEHAQHKNTKDETTIYVFHLLHDATSTKILLVLLLILPQRGYNDMAYLLQFAPASKQGECSGNLHFPIPKMDAHSSALHNQLAYKWYRFYVIRGWAHDQHPELVFGKNDKLSSYDSMLLCLWFLLKLKKFHTYNICYNS